MIGKPTSSDDFDAGPAARAYSLSNEALHMVALQCRRIRSQEPEDDSFAFRWWTDCQFLIIALWRLRSAGELAHRTGLQRGSVYAAIEAFDSAVPCLRRMRNVGEHAGDYAMENGHDRSVRSESLQAGFFDGVTFGWLNGHLNIDAALEASEHLHRAIKSAAIAAAFGGEQNHDAQAPQSMT